MRASFACSWLRAHPRVCGENYVNFFAKDTAGGSSPRVRGKPASERIRPAASRLIPACAGKTICDCNCAICCRAHPRVCGENLIKP